MKTLLLILVAFVAYKVVLHEIKLHSYQCENAAFRYSLLDTQKALAALKGDDISQKVLSVEAEIAHDCDAENNVWGIR